MSEIQEIRASERRFYQKITDIYAAGVDYSLDSQITRDFFSTVQNKMHYAIHHQTAADILQDKAVKLITENDFSFNGEVL